MSRRTTLPTPIMPFSLAQATNEIRRSYGDEIDIVGKAKTLNKFGRNSAVGTTSETVWEVGGNEAYVETNIIDTISSSNAADTAVIAIEGHTITDGKLMFSIQTVTLNGQNKVLLSTPVVRVSRAAVTSGTLAGDVYVYEDTAIVAGVPSDLTKAHITILGDTSGNTQSYKAATSISDSDYFIVTSCVVSVSKKTSAFVDFSLEARQLGQVFRPLSGRFSTSSTGQTTVAVEFNPALIVQRNSDVRVVASASAANTQVDATFSGYLASIADS